MNADELLEQIRKTDPDAHFEDHDGIRVLVTSSIESNKLVLLNPANMHIIGRIDFGSDGSGG